MKKRQSFDKALKAKVVLEALREELTLQEITKKIRRASKPDKPLEKAGNRELARDI